MEDLRRLLLLRLLVVLGPCVMLLWLWFGLTPPQPLPLSAVALFLGWGMLAVAVVHPFARRMKPVTAGELFVYLHLDVLALALLLALNDLLAHGQVEKQFDGAQVVYLDSPSPSPTWDSGPKPRLYAVVDAAGEVLTVEKRVRPRG